jgi:cytochrome P450
LWSSPDEFQPDRFLRDQPPTDQYFPFGTGPHQCLGRQFALMEAQLVTAEVLRTGTLRVTGDRATTRLKPAIALTPDPSPTAMFQPHHGGTR